MEIVELKVIILSTLFLSCFVASLLPQGCVMFAAGRRLDHQGRADGNRQRQRVVFRLLRLLNCFGGGVFLATCLMDLLPEVREEFEAVAKEIHLNPHFPFAEFVTIVGFFLILCIEQVAQSIQEVTSVDDGRANLESSCIVDGAAGGDVDERSHLLNENTNISHSECNADEVVVVAPSPDVLSADGEAEVTSTQSPRTGSGSSSLRSIMLLLALSLHSIFEGLAIGLQNTTAQLFGIFSAVAIHKTILALSLGITLVQASFNKVSMVASSFCFAIMAPVGIGLGILLSGAEDGVGKSTASGLLQGIATGTFLYITFFEVLAKEIGQPQDGLLKVFFAFAGFGIIVGSMFLGSEF